MNDIVEEGSLGEADMKPPMDLGMATSIPQPQSHRPQKGKSSNRSIVHGMGH